MIEDLKDKYWKIKLNDFPLLIISQILQSFELFSHIFSKGKMSQKIMQKEKDLFWTRNAFH